MQHRADTTREQGAAGPPLLPYSLTHSLTNRGQSAIEYAVLAAVVVATLVSMSVYVKRALEGKWRSVGDTFSQGRQYEPGVTVVSQ